MQFFWEKCQKLLACRARSKAIQNFNAEDRRGPTEGLPSVGLRPVLRRFLRVLALESTPMTLGWDFDPNNF